MLCTTVLSHNLELHSQLLLIIINYNYSTVASIVLRRE